MASSGLLARLCHEKHLTRGTKCKSVSNFQSEPLHGLAKYPETLGNRYGLTDFDKMSYEILEDLGRKRGCVISGGEVDTVRASNILLDEFRASKLGNITLEFPGE